jgi:hypothetical protein
MWGDQIALMSGSLKRLWATRPRSRRRLARNAATRAAFAARSALSSRTISTAPLCRLWSPEFVPDPGTCRSVPGSSRAEFEAEFDRRYYHFAPVYGVSPPVF